MNAGHAPYMPQRGQPSPTPPTGRLPDPSWTVDELLTFTLQVQASSRAHHRTERNRP